MKMTRILVCGGRDFANRELFDRTMLLYLADAKVVIHGGASGADKMASAWAKEYGIQEIACPADWQLYGRMAGPKRNQAMLDLHKPDTVIAFPGGRGTADMLKRGVRAGLPCVQVA